VQGCPSHAAPSAVCAAHALHGHSHPKAEWAHTPAHCGGGGGVPAHLCAMALTRRRRCGCVIVSWQSPRAHTPVVARDGPCCVARRCHEPRCRRSPQRCADRDCLRTTYANDGTTYANDGTTYGNDGTTYGNNGTTDGNYGATHSNGMLHRVSTGHRRTAGAGGGGLASPHAQARGLRRVRHDDEGAARYTADPSADAPRRRAERS
jgi:hypothetical protein